MPPGWNWFKYDKKIFIQLQEKRVIRKLKPSPLLALLIMFFIKYFKGIDMCHF